MSQQFKPLLGNASSYVSTIPIERVTNISKPNSTGKCSFRDDNSKHFSYSLKVGFIEKINKKKISVKGWYEDEFNFSKAITAKILSVLSAANLEPKFVAFKRVYVNTKKINVNARGYDICCTLSKDEESDGINAFYYLKKSDDDDDEVDIE